MNHGALRRWSGAERRRRASPRAKEKQQEDLHSSSFQHPRPAPEARSGEQPNIITAQARARCCRRPGAAEPHLLTALRHLPRRLLRQPPRRVGVPARPREAVALLRDRRPHHRPKPPRAAGTARCAPRATARQRRRASDGTTSVVSKFLLAGESSLQARAAVAARLVRRAERGGAASTASLADCGCDAGAAEVTSAHPVRAGELVQVSGAVAIRRRGGVARELFVAFSEGGVCDYNDVEDDQT